jgi:phage baseplate assembly protein W
MNLDVTLPPPPMGWPLFPFPDEHGQVAYPRSLAESVRQQLRILLSVRPGEQLLHPAYGAGLVEFLGEPDTLTTRQRIHDRIRDAIGRWETRIEVDRIEVDEFPDEPGRLRVEIAYRLRRTGELQTFGVNLEVTPPA